MIARRARGGRGGAPAALAASVLRLVCRWRRRSVTLSRPSDPGVVNYAVLPKGSVGNIVGAPMRFESTFLDPFRSFYVDNAACNNWADIGLPDVYADPDLASLQRIDDAGVGHRPDALRQAGGRRLRHQRGGRPGLPPRRRPHDRLQWPDHRHAST